MTVAATVAGVLRTGNGAAVEFTFTFPARSIADIKVSNLQAGALVVVNPADYVVALAADSLSGTVTFLVAPINARVFYIFRDTPGTQLVSVSSQLKYDPKVVEGVWDKLTLLVQEVQTEVDLAVKTLPGQDPAILVAELLQARIDAAASAASAAVSATATIGFASRAAAIAATVPVAQQALQYVEGNTLVSFTRKAGGTALVQADGSTWVPAGDPTPEHFGTPNTAAFQAAFDYAATLNGLGKVVGRSGTTYNCGAITAVGGVSFDGNGCSIRATGNSWLTITSGVAYSVSVIENFRLRPTIAPIVGSVGISFESAAFNTRRGIIIRNVVVSGDDGFSVSAFGFEKNIRLTNASYALIDELRIDGTLNPLKVGPGYAGQFVAIGISLEGQSIGTEIHHARIAGIHTGIQASTLQQEGLQIIACELVGVRDGYDLRAAVFGGPGMWLVNCHANASRKGFDLGRRTDVSMTGCTAYKSSSLISEDWIGFDLENVFGGQMTSCHVVYNDLAHPGSKGVRLLNSQGITGAANTFRNPKIALSHEGGNIGCTWGATSFMGSGVYTETCFATATSDDRISLGPHSRVSGWSAPYVVATAKTSITIDRGRLKYNKSTGRTISAGETIVLTAEGSAQVQRIGLAAGAGAYDCIIELSAALAIEGDFFDFFLNLPSLADRRVIVRDGIAGPTLSTIFTGASARYSARYVFDGSNWLAHSIHQSVFL